MACLINRSDSGQITSVESKKGKRSALFDKIHSNIFLADGETSLRLYMNALSPAALKEFGTTEPDLVYKTSEGIYEDLESMLIANSNGPAHMGFQTESGEFMEIGNFSLDSSLKNQFLVSVVQQGFLSAERSIQPDGTIRYEGKGEFLESKQLSAIFTENELTSTIGEGRIVNHGDGTLSIDFHKEFTTAQSAKGAETIRIDDIPQFIKNNPDITNKADLAFEYKVSRDFPRPLTGKQTPKKKINADVKGITNSLNGFLKSVGFTATSLEEYRKNYNTKFGQDPDIEALADIANRVVALKGKVDNTADLTEEVAHVAIEMYSDQNSIASAMLNVHLTEEYTEFAEQYRQKYSQFLEGFELEERVRKEILGKVLKNQLINKFNTENVTPEKATLIEKLREIWNTVVERITGRVTDSHIRSLKKLNTKIANSIVTQNTEDFQNDITDTESFYYSLMENRYKKISQDLKVTGRVINDLHKKVLKQEAPNQSEVEALNEAQNENTIMSSFNVITGIVSNQMETIEAAIKHASNTGELISQKDINTAHILNESLVKMLNNVRNSIEKVHKKEGFDDARNQKLFDQLSIVTDEINTKLAAVNPELKKDNENYVEKMVADVVEEFDMSTEEEAEFRGHVEGNIKDASWLGKMFGIASQSKNPLIQLISKRVNMISQKVRIGLKDRMNRELSEIDSKNLLQYQKDITQKGSYHFISPVNWAKYEADLAETENKIIAELTDSTVEAVAGKLAEKGVNTASLLDDAQQLEFKDRVKEWKNTEGIERRNTDAHYAKREARFEKANIDKQTQNYINSKNSNMFAIKKKYQNPDGTIDQSKFSEGDKVAQRNAFKSHQNKKSAYDSSGELRHGLSRVNISEITQGQRDSMPFEIDPEYTGDVTILSGEVSLEELEVESRRSLDLFNLDMLYRTELKGESKTNVPLKAYLTQLEEEEAKGGEVGYEWAVSNGSLGLSSEFYEGIGATEGFNEVAENWINSLDSETAIDKRRLFTEYKRLQRIRKDLLKQNKKSNNTLETDAYHMTAHNRAKVLGLDTDIAKTKKALNMPYDLQGESSSNSESALTEDYHAMLKESGKSKFEFALGHMTRDNSVKVQSFALDIEDALNGVKSYLKPSFDNFLQESLSNGLIPEGSTQKEAISILQDEYAERFVSSYFRRFQPAGYSEAISALKSGKIKTSDVISNKESLLAEYPGLEYIEITPDYTWSEDINNGEYLNPNFKEGIPFTPRMDKYLNDEFFSRFGIKKEDYIASSKDDLTALNPTQNADQYEFLTRMVKLREESLDLQGDLEYSNKYLRPQISKNAFEVVTGGSFNKATAKDMFSDIFQSKADEKDYGEVVEGTKPSDVNVKIIPKYFNTKLASAEIVSDNVFQSSILDYEAALRYNERINSERELKALEDKISDQTLIDNGASTSKSKIFKKGETSNYLQKAQEMLDHHLYGKRESRHMNVEIGGKDFDLTQGFKSFTKVVQFINLGYNPIVDATSYTTGVFNNAVDAYSGDYYSPQANKIATGMLPRMITEYTAEAGNIKKSSKLNHLMEYYGIFDVNDRVTQSGSGRLLRGLSKSQYGISKLANLGVTPKVMLSVLHDHKYIDGKFRSYNNFKKVRKAANKEVSEASLKAEWNAKTESFYDHITIDSQFGVKMNDKFKEKYPENTEEVFDALNQTISTKITHINQNVDSIVSTADQTAAQRDAGMNAFLLHRSWILLNMTRRFKGRHFNVATGQMEEGHYKKSFKILSTATKSLIKTGSLKETKYKMEEFDRRNIKRMGADTVGLLILIAITNALLAGDDEDDSYIEDWAQLIALRTTNETESASIVGVYGTAEDVYKAPLIQLRTVGTLVDSFTALTEGDTEKSWKKFKSGTPLKRIDQLGDIQKQIETFNHFNRGTLRGTYNIETDAIEIANNGE